MSLSEILSLACVLVQLEQKVNLPLSAILLYGVMKSRL